MKNECISRQPSFEWATFENGMNGWVFKSWMPKNHSATCTLREGPGFSSPNFLHFYADGTGDDGIFFIQKEIRGDIEGGITFVQVSWWFEPPDDPAQVVGSWPRVVYIGPQKDLAQEQTHYSFIWFEGTAGLSNHEGSRKWYNQAYRVKLDTPNEVLLVAIGWKINFESEREFLMDDVLLSYF
jgi:hypothetical protein